MKKLLIFLIICVFLYLGITYALNTFLPKKIKIEAEEFVKNALNKNIDINHISVSPTRGILLKNVIIYGKDINDIYLRANEVSLTPFYLSFLHKKKIFFSLVVDGAYFKIIRNKEGETNLPSIKTNLEKSSIFFVKDIKINNLDIDFEDEKENFKKSLPGLNMQSSLSILGKINFQLTWQECVSILANYDLGTRNLNGIIDLKNIDLAEFKSFLKNIDLKSGMLNTAKLNFEGNKSYAIKGDVNIEDISFIKSAIKYEGNLDLSMAVEFGENKKIPTYNLQGTLKNGEIKNIPHLDTLSDARATFNLDNQILNVPSLEAKVDTKPIKANGQLNYSAYPNYVITINSKLPLKELAYFIKKIKPLPFDYTGDGSSEIDLTLKGNVQENKVDYSLDYKIENAYFNDIKEIAAQGNMKKDLLIIKNGHLNYRNNIFKISGKLTDFSSPQISLNATGDALSLKTSAKYINNMFDVESINIAATQTDIEAKAQIGVKKTPMVIIEGSGSTSFADIKKIMSSFKINYPLLNKLKPQGETNINFTVNGNADIKKWKLTLLAESNKLKVYNLESENTVVKLYRDENEIIINPLLSELAKGKIHCISKITPANNSGEVNIIVNDVDLAQIRKQLNLKDKKLAGKLSCQAYIKSNALSTLSKLAGNGIIQIKEGNIWEISFLEGLGEFLFIPDFAKIQFEEGYSEVFFEEEDIIFENLELNSSKMDLSGAGRISLDGNIHFMFFPEFNDDFISSSEGLKKITTEFLGKRGLVIEVKGPLNDPSYEMKPLFLSPLDKIKDFFDELAK